VVKTVNNVAPFGVLMGLTIRHHSAQQ